ncbi:hypothetical protein [Rhizobium sp. LC145]|jgi:hypothetical protein|uniref:hypothetical protein n=1 Tax=Rhizobium sp. LC145 TaxID=1120688 RepID=UPI000629E620|nr:hypothetical protein [Rhizobium sp. LC145]KKX27085.1 hypothetical protein YH62_22150 [Rhizobium sp. LC145]TKT56599.1 hypothetical protein FDR95_15600 [Rhizobiaceae bacterium LC148]
MKTGRDEQLMGAINAEADRFLPDGACETNLGQIAARLHERYPHRTGQEIESRLRLVMWSRGQFSAIRPDRHGLTAATKG